MLFWGYPPDLTPTSSDVQRHQNKLDIDTNTDSATQFREKGTPNGSRR